MIVYNHTWPGFEYPIGEHGFHQLQLQDSKAANLSLDCMSCGGPGRATRQGSLWPGKYPDGLRVCSVAVLALELGAGHGTMLTEP